MARIDGKGKGNIKKCRDNVKEQDNGKVFEITTRKVLPEISRGFADATSKRMLRGNIKTYFKMNTLNKEGVYSSLF